MRGRSAQQQSIVRQKDMNERIIKEESEKRKQKEENDKEYLFNYDDVKNKLSKQKYERLLEEINRYKELIIKQLLIEEERGHANLCTPLTTSESQGTELIELFSTEVCFTRQENIIKVYKR